LEAVWPVTALYTGPLGRLIHARLSFMPAFQAPPSRSTAGDDGTLARGSQTDQRPLSGGHARRLRALIPAADLLAWKQETKWGVRRDDRRSREAITDGRGLLLWLSFLVRGERRYVSGLRRVREPQPRFRAGGEADACRTGSTAHPWCRCTWASRAARWGHATWSVSSPTSGEPAFLAVAPRRQNRGTDNECNRPTCRTRLSAGGTAPARRTADAGPAVSG
jgi:hypothetical protein